VSAEARTLRAWLRGIFLAGSVGTTLELLLLEHVGDAWQLLPVVLLLAGVVLLIPAALGHAAWPLHAFRLTMLLCIGSGLVGVLLHYTGNAEFEREIQPDAAGISLFWEAIAGATPVLAPGTMALLGAVGWLGAGQARDSRS